MIREKPVDWLLFILHILTAVIAVESLVKLVYYVAKDGTGSAEKILLLNSEILSNV